MAISRNVKVRTLMRPIIWEVLYMHCMCILAFKYPSMTIAISPNVNVWRLMRRNLSRCHIYTRWKLGGATDRMYNNYDSSMKGESLLIPVIMISIHNNCWSTCLFLFTAASYQLWISYHRLYHRDNFPNNKLSSTLSSWLFSSIKKVIIGRLIINPDCWTLLISLQSLQLSRFDSRPMFW